MDEEESQRRAGYRESGIFDKAEERVVFSFFGASFCLAFWIPAGSLAAALSLLSAAKIWTYPFVLKKYIRKSN